MQLFNLLFCLCIFWIWKISHWIVTLHYKLLLNIFRGIRNSPCEYDRCWWVTMYFCRYLPNVYTENHKQWKLLTDAVAHHLLYLLGYLFHLLSLCWATDSFCITFCISALHVRFHIFLSVIPPGSENFVRKYVKILYLLILFCYFGPDILPHTCTYFIFRKRKRRRPQHFGNSLVLLK